MNPKLVIAWACSIAVAVALARGTAPRQVVTVPGTPVAHAPAAATMPPPPPLPLPASGGISVADVRRVVREELAAMPPAVATSPEEVAAAEAARAEAEAASAVVRDRALVGVRAAIDAGRWTDANRRELRLQLASLDRADVELVLGELVPAVNDGKVHVETDGMLF